MSAVFLLLAGLLYAQTGFLQGYAIDDKDKAFWQYEDGVVKNAESFVLQGESGKCWVMVHGYTSTPDELKIVARAVNDEFDDSVFVPLLYGHGTVPSNIQKHSVVEWYEQVRALADEKGCRYLLGSSMGASMVLRYAEEYAVDGVVLVGLPFALEPTYVPSPVIGNVIAPLVGYLKKDLPGATVDDPVGRKAHIATFSFPLKGVAELIDFNVGVQQKLGKVNAPVLFLHATTDTVANVEGAHEAFNQMQSTKTFVEFAGDHIVFRDYDKQKAVDEVLKFRKIVKS